MLEIIGINLFMAACMWLFLPIVYVSMRNNTVCKNNLILSVTLPPEAQGDAEVMAYCEAFKKRLLRMALLLTAVLVPAIFLPWMSISSTCSMIWLLIAMFAIMRTYGKGYQGLREIKRRRGWVIATAGQSVVDLKPMKLPKRLKTGWFVPPMILTLLPLISCFLDDWGAWAHLLVIMSVSNFLVCAMSLLFYGLIFRQKKDILDHDTNLTEALTRLRRRNWTKTWLLLSWLTAFYSLAVWFCQGDQTWFSIWTGVYCVLLTGVTVCTEFATRFAQQRLTQGRAVQPVVDEDDYWIWGQFYYNPNSNKLMINERVGMGMSTNFAHPVGKALAVLTLLVLLALPVLGGWLVVEEMVPMEITRTEDAVVVSRVGELYRIPLDEIEAVELLEQLPPATRTWGTGMPSLLKGSFFVEGYGNCTLCLNPKEPPFLLIDTIHETYLLGSEAVTALDGLTGP